MGLSLYKVEHVVIRDLTFQHFQVDGVNVHDLCANVVLDNVRSQRVLERNGFEPFGVAPAYLKIAGAWRDHVMYQVLNPSPM